MECISIDEFEMSAKNSLCMCIKAFIDDQCEIVQTQLCTTCGRMIRLLSILLRETYYLANVKPIYNKSAIISLVYHFFV
jgi:hypothetical protein